MISFDINNEHNAWDAIDIVSALEQCAKIIDDGVEGVVGDWVVSVLLTNDEQIRELNKDWRGKDKPTNVLSFPADDDFPTIPGELPSLGDLALAYETCAREAKEKGITFTDHLTHLILHGLLHLIGYDHIEDEEAEVMESLETRLLSQLGIADPYGPA